MGIFLVLNFTIPNVLMINMTICSNLQNDRELSPTSQEAGRHRGRIERVGG